MDCNSDLFDIFKKVSSKLNWKNYEVISDVINEKGNGFMGEFFLATIKNKDTEEKVDLAVKCAFKNEERRKEIQMHVAFHNEITFYDQVIPHLLKFVEGKGLKFDFIVKFYGGVADEGKEMFAMENIRNLGYKLIDRNRLLDEEHVKFVFETYGKYHGMSFAFKDQKPEEFKVLMGKSIDIMRKFEEAGSEGFGVSLKQAAAEAFANVSEDIREGCKPYLEDPLSIFFKYNRYKGDFGCMLHGDCWSNNMMFKYQDSKLIGMKLLDFQLLACGTPVLDLAYFLYAGAPIEIYGNLDKYLRIYYDSLCKTVTSLGSDPLKLLPWESLKEDWKIYCKYGFIMSLLINKIKLMDNENVQELVKETEFLEEFGKIKISDEKLETYHKRSKDLIEHLYKEKFLDLEQ